MKDPRCNLRNQVDYCLPELMFLVISAAISGMNTWNDIAMFGEQKQDWLRTYFPFKDKMPWPSTLSRLFARLDSEEFGQYFIDWVASLSKLTQGEVVAFDGKTMRGSYDKTNNKAAIHMVSAFVSHQNICLGQLATEEKSNEITAIPKLLDLLTLEGCTVTTDAMGCQVEISKKILQKKANYILQVKNNQKGLLEQVEKVFEITELDDTNLQYNLDHGRVEQRECAVICNLTHLDGYQNWPGIQTIIRIQSQRIQKRTGEKENSTRYYISSKTGSATNFNQDIRAHWGIENKLHWSLDVSFKEDNSRKRKGHSAANFALFSKIALNLLNNCPTKMSKNRKRLKALLDDNFREKLLAI
jgi:predicted transposase YbfD/YdcC